MSITMHWFLPMAGDSRDIAPLGEDGHHRAPSFDYLSQIARAAESQGFTGLLTPTGTYCEDAWVTTAALSRETRTIKFLVAFRPGYWSPTLAAQMAGTYQRITDGRMLLNVVTGGDEVEQRRFGDWLDKEGRYERCDEFLTVLRGAWSGEPFDFEGKHIHVEGSTVNGVPDPIPPVYFGGASPAAERVAARHADIYLTWGEPVSMVGERVARMKELAAAEGRELRFGIRLHAISRDKSSDAWAETDRLLEVMDDKTLNAMQKVIKQTGSVGQQRMNELHGGSKEKLTIAPNLWAGVGLVRGGAGTALVGSHEEVAERIAEYHEAGFDEFIMSGHPHLEETYHFGEGVLPILRREGILVDSLSGDGARAGVAPAAGPAYASAPVTPDDHVKRLSAS